MDKNWKATERRLAAMLGGERVPITGRARGSAPDIRHPWLSIEVKARKTLPTWVLDAMAQARAAARHDQLPVIVLHKVGARHSEALIAMTVGDFVQWFGDGG